MADRKINYNTVYDYVKTQWESCSALVALLAGGDIWEEEIAAQQFPAMVVHAIIKTSEPHITLGISKSQAPHLTCPFEIVSSSKKSDGSIQSLSDIRTEAYNIMDEAENFIRNNPHWGDRDTYLSAMPGAVTPTIVERKDWRSYHLMGELLLWLRVQ